MCIRSDGGRFAERGWRVGARFGLLGCVLAISWLAFTPSPDVPGLGWDKLNHVAAFVVLAMLAELGWPEPGSLRWRIALLLGYGAFIELVQALLSYRSGSVLDLLADAVGIGVFLSLVPVLRRFLTRGYR